MKKILLLCLVLFSCSKSNEDLNKKVLNQISTPIQHFDLHLATGLASSLQLAKVYETLLETHPFDGPYKLLPNLAASLPTMSKNGLTYTFKIRKGVRYHDCKCLTPGRTVVANDFVNSFKRLSDPRLVSPHFNYFAKKIVGMKEWKDAQVDKSDVDYSLPLAGVSAPNDETLIIRVKNRDIEFLNELTTARTAPIPLEAIKYYKNDFSNVEVGTGPFVLSKYVRKSKIEYVRNPSFRDKYFPKTSNEKFKTYVSEYGGKKLPFLEKIKVKIIKESQTQWLQFMKGNVDYLEIPKDNFSESLSPQKELNPEMKRKGIVLGITPSYTNVYYYGINQKDPLMKNVHLRRAIAHIIDTEEYNKLFFNGTAILATGILPPGISGNTPPAKSPYVHKTSDSALKAAMSELKKAGFSKGSDVPEITISVKSSSTGRQVGEFFVKEIKKLGIKGKVNSLPWPTLLKNAQSGNYQVFYLAWFVGIPSAYQFLELVYGPNHPDSFNRVGYLNKNLDRMYEQSKSLRTRKLQSPSIRIMNQMVTQDVPLVPLVHARDFFVRQAWLKNYVPSEEAGGLEQYFDVDLGIKKKFISEF